MARGIAAAMVLVAMILSMTVLSGLGYYAELGADLNVEGQNEDVVAAAEQLSGIGFGEGRSDSILQGPLASVVPAVGLFTSFVTVIGNTSGVLQLLFGLPPVVADNIETFARLVMLVTALYLVRSGSPV